MRLGLVAKWIRNIGSYIDTIDSLRDCGVSVVPSMGRAEKKWKPVLLLCPLCIVQVWFWILSYCSSHTCGIVVPPKYIFAFYYLFLLLGVSVLTTYLTVIYDQLPNFPSSKKQCIQDKNYSVLRAGWFSTFNAESLIKSLALDASK